MWCTPFLYTLMLIFTGQITDNQPQTLTSGNPNQRIFSKSKKFIWNVFKIFRKAPSRISYFIEQVPNIPLSPEPVLTRWGTWIAAVDYYTENFKIIKNIVKAFDKKESLVIKKAQKLFQNANLQELIFISTDSSWISKTINKLESQSWKLTQAVNVVENQIEQSIEQLSNPTNEIGEKVFNKIKDVIENNKEFQEIRLIWTILNGEKN